jgi:hypothetical protein
MSRIDQIRDIIAQSQYAKIDGVLVDGVTAKAILACYEAGNERTQNIIETASIAKVGALALRMVAK